MYRENPKTKGSGLICVIPQKGVCPQKCEDCFFQSGRSYLEPLEDNLPNMPEPENVSWQVVRVNDGNDSNNNQEKVINDTAHFLHKFYNTSIPKDLDKFPGPVVLTVNPRRMTDKRAVLLQSPPLNLMYVRFRTNTWNLPLCDKVVKHYSQKGIPIVLTFMAYFDTASKIPTSCSADYIFRRRTLNSYFAITTSAWHDVMRRYENNKWVHSCGKIEGEKGDTHCRHCGNCLREYFATLTRMSEKAPT